MSNKTASTTLDSAQKSLQDKPLLAQLKASYENLQSEALAAGQGAALREARKSGWNQFWSQGWPTRQNEEWKYTNLGALLDWQPKLQQTPAKLTLPQNWTQWVGEETIAIVFYNGVFRPELSRLHIDGVEGVRIHSWETSDTSVEALFAERAEQSSNSLAHLNQALAQSGARVQVDAKAIINRPIHIVYWNEGAEAAGTAGEEANQTVMISPRTLIQMGSLSQATVLETYLGFGESASFCNSVTRIELAEGAALEYGKAQCEGMSSYHVGQSYAHLKRDSVLRSFNLSVGGKLSRHGLHVELAGAGAQADLDALYLVRDQQHVDNSTVIDHAVANTESRQLYKGILTDRSRAVFNGKILIRQDAQESHSAQLNKNLLLSAKAEVDTKPQLEIYADNVKAAHGATIGQLDKEQLFYLQSRAVSRQDAIQMLARGFAEEVLLPIRQNWMREWMDRVLDENFGYFQDEIRKTNEPGA